MTGVGRAPQQRRRQDSGPGPLWGDVREQGRGPVGRPARGQSTPARGPALTGLGAVAFIFAVTVAIATAESLLGVGLRTFTLVALAVSTLLAGLWVRRADLATIVVAPPLVFAAVAMLEIVLAPTLRFTPTVLASILVRGFPTMAIASALGLLVCGYRVLRRS